MERIYKNMSASGAMSIAVGIVILVTGLVAGILSVVSGGLLLKRRADITF